MTDFKSEHLEIVFNERFGHLKALLNAHSMATLAKHMNMADKNHDGTISGTVENADFFTRYQRLNPDIAVTLDKGCQKPHQSEALALTRQLADDLNALREYAASVQKGHGGVVIASDEARDTFFDKLGLTDMTKDKMVTKAFVHSSSGDMVGFIRPEFDALADKLVDDLTAVLGKHTDVKKQVEAMPVIEKITSPAFIAPVCKAAATR
jgi:hypothetical protein